MHRASRMSTTELFVETIIGGLLDISHLFNMRVSRLLSAYTLGYLRNYFILQVEPNRHIMLGVFSHS